MHGGKPPATITFGDKAVPNFRKDEPPMTMLGREQKAWFKSDARRGRTATWKIWGATNGTLDMRADPQNLPAGLAKTTWPGTGYRQLRRRRLQRSVSASAPSSTTSSATSRSTGFVTVSGDRHSFWAGYAAKDLAAAGVRARRRRFITGSISAPGLAEALEHGLKDHPLRPLFTARARRTRGMKRRST